jgi:hypothetical protein
VGGEDGGEECGKAEVYVADWGRVEGDGEVRAVEEVFALAAGELEEGWKG